MPVRILEIDNTYKKWKDSMRAVGFKDSQLREEVTIETELLQEQQVIHNAKFQTTKNRVERWEQKLKKLLSTELPTQYKGKRRPALRQFPYMVTGALRDSIDVNLEMTKKRASWVYTLTLKADGLDNNGSADHATLTNLAANSGARDVRWKSWADNVFGVVPHSARIISAGILMRQYLFKPI